MDYVMSEFATLVVPAESKGLWKTASADWLPGLRTVALQSRGTGPGPSRLVKIWLQSANQSRRIDGHEIH
ncbi:hypothetical protein BDW60DRAFT_190589 [Aspergillus nidulans var. acristatus]